MTSTLVLGILAGLSVGMAATSAVTVKWAAFAHAPLRASVVQFILLMMAAMFVGVLVYFAVGGGTGFVTGVWVAAALMAASVLVVFVGFLRELRDREEPAEATSAPTSRSWFVASVVALVIANEFLMGWSFSLITGGIAPGLGPGARDTPSVLSAAVTSPWFVFPMVIEMLLTLRWLIAAFPRAMGRLLLVQPAIMFCSPPTLPGLAWLVSTALGASALMAGAIAYLLVVLYRGERLSPVVLGYVGRLFLSFGVMAVGVGLWVAFGIPELFAVSILLQMSVFLHAVINIGRYVGSPIGPTSTSALPLSPTVQD